MIIVKLSELVNSAESTKNILAAKLPVKIAYQLSRIGKSVQTELTTFGEQRQKLAGELGKQSEDGTKYEFDKDGAIEFDKQMRELLDTEIKIDLEPVKVSDFGEKAEIAAVDLLACEKFIVP